VYLTLAFTYFVLCFGLSRVAYRLERRLSSRRPAATHAPALHNPLGQPT